MSQIVLDASMALSWLLPDEAAPSTRTVQGELQKAGRVWVASHWRLEVANALCMAERRKRLNAAGLAQAVALFTQLPVTVDPETHERASAETLALARQHGLTTYDAACLEIALRLGASLASLDSELRKTARKLGVALLPQKRAAES